MKKFAIATLISVLATGAFAHSKVDTTSPADGAALTEVPAEIGFHFVKDIRLTRVDIVHQDRPAARLDLGDKTSFERQFTLPLEEMGEGTYRIEWRGLGADGHAMQGAFTFTVE